MFSKTNLQIKGEKVTIGSQWFNEIDTSHLMQSV